MKNFCTGLVAGVALALACTSTVAQTPVAGNTQDGIDYSNDPCGNPLIESMIWQPIEGKVLQVADGRTILLTINDGHQRLRVHLTGIKLSSDTSANRIAEQFLAQRLLNKEVEVLVNPSDWPDSSKKPREITGVVHSKTYQQGESDVAKSLLVRGLVKFAQPRPYTMSGYDACQYRRSEAEAKSEKLGLWQKSG
jgi:endonuclease YncB( thermonuclease family)